MPDSLKLALIISARGCKNRLTSKESEHEEMEEALFDYKCHWGLPGWNKGVQVGNAAERDTVTKEEGITRMRQKSNHQRLQNRSDCFLLLFKLLLSICIKNYEDPCRTLQDLLIEGSLHKSPRNPRISLSTTMKLLAQKKNCECLVFV